MTLTAGYRRCIPLRASSLLIRTTAQMKSMVIKEFDCHNSVSVMLHIKKYPRNNVTQADRVHRPRPPSRVTLLTGSDTERSKKTVTHMPGLKCYQPARLKSVEPQLPTKRGGSRHYSSIYTVKPIKAQHGRAISTATMVPRADAIC